MKRLQFNLKNILIGLFQILISIIFIYLIVSKSSNNGLLIYIDYIGISIFILMLLMGFITFLDLPRVYIENDTLVYLNIFRKRIFSLEEIQITKKRIIFTYFYFIKHRNKYYSISSSSVNRITKEKLSNLISNYSIV
ncbi:MAG TPA: hypothetical protein PKY56_09570 [Candidatus Kapabacteria bacterium]|nr:hypothetical protein [Candidatus Kapabacteria bacterium]HPO62837.1 hypothetical protein [Candidatus Kapabacteria bacterium]